MSKANQAWHRELNGYHWFVLIVCTLGWLFDCLDQQLFNAERKPAIAELMGLPSSDLRVDDAAGLATSILLIGWATGGIAFGIMGDRIGRARTMVFTILAYSVFTGLSAFSFGVWDFIFYRFMTGLGVGGQFAVGVSLVAETLPDRARAPALGLLQALSAVGNVTAGLIVMLFESLAASGAIPHSAWRWVFGVGILPALLAVLVMRKLKEPERWQKAVAEGHQVRKAGSLRELFTDPRWRKNTIVGMLLGSAGVIGLWGIGVFSNDLTHSVFAKKYEQDARDQGEADKDRRFVCLAVRHPKQLAALEEKVAPSAILGQDSRDKDGRLLYAAALTLVKQEKQVTPEAVLALLDEPAAGKSETPLGRIAPKRKAQSDEDRQRRAAYLENGQQDTDAGRASGVLAEDAERIAARQKSIGGQLGFWRSINLMFFNIGAFFGIYSFSLVTQRIGRRPTFAIFFLLAMFSTAASFLWMSRPWHLFCLVPLMGFFQLSVFGGYAIYFPELFPTRLRSTGTSFCYNIARYVAAAGPTVLTLLSSEVFGTSDEPMRYAGMTMCTIFLLGVVVLPFAPETRGQPLPE
jgi:MFS family permease